MKRLRTFIVDDIALLRENLASALEELAPVEIVGTAENEANAVRWIVANEANCDLMIIDISLEEGSGLGVLRAMTKLAGSVTSIILTSYATAEVRQRCLELGAAQVFDRSREIDALVRFCSRLADLRAR